jgi:transposase
MKAQPNLDQLNNEQVGALAAQLLVAVEQKEDLIQRKEQANRHLEAVNEKLAHENAILKHHRFARRSETLNQQQRNLLDELIDADIGAIEEERSRAGEEVGEKPKAKKQQPKRAPLPPKLPRVTIEHEPENTTCRCGCQLKRIGEDISEKLDYTPGSFSVECHVRGKWVCDQSETLTQALVPAQVIDKGISTSGLLSHLLVVKYGDHLPLYRQESIFARAGLPFVRSTLADWVGRCGGCLAATD